MTIADGRQSSEPLQSASLNRAVANLLLLLPFAACAQQPLVLLDPACGGTNSGAQIADRVPEKQVTLDLAGRLASLLRARGFAVSMTREADVDVSNDARAALANNTHPMACILLYAAPGGSGVHVYSTGQRQAAAAGAAVHWDEAQAPFAERSQALANDLHAALDQAHITASAGKTWMRPLDNMQCPAVAVELLPEKVGKGADDSSYQSHVANAVANTLLQWRGKMAAMAPPPAPVMASPAPRQAPSAPVVRPDVPPSSADAPAATPASSTPQSDSGTSKNPVAPARRVPQAPAQPAQPAAPVVRQPEAQPDRSQP